jgi:hypothetical protein
MTIQHNYSKYVDARNEDFINQIKDNNLKIELYQILNADGIPNPKIWLCQPQGDTYKLSYYLNNECIDSFTHEILHIYLLTLGFHDTIEFKTLVDTLENINNILPLNLIGHINNVFAHEKFYQLYIERGFEKEKFTCDYNDPFVTYKENIESDFHTKKIPNEGIMYFIATFFSAMDAKNSIHKKEIDDHLKFLQSIDIGFYNMLFTSWQKWTNQKEVNINYDIISELIQNVATWYDKRQYGRAN